MKSYILMAEKQKEELRQNFCKVCGGDTISDATRVL
jgi:hypothetical protein